MRSLKCWEQSRRCSGFRSLLLLKWVWFKLVITRGRVAAYDEITMEHLLKFQEMLHCVAEPWSELEFVVFEQGLKYR